MPTFRAVLVMDDGTVHTWEPADPTRIEILEDMQGAHPMMRPGVWVSVTPMPPAARVERDLLVRDVTHTATAPGAYRDPLRDELEALRRENAELRRMLAMPAEAQCTAAGTTAGCRTCRAFR